MSDGIIKSTESLNAVHVGGLKRRHQREVDALENHHRKYKTDLKEGHRSEIVDIQEENQRQIGVEVDKKEKILAEMRSHLQTSQALTEKELKALKERNQNEVASLRDRLSLHKEAMTSENQLHLEDLNERYKRKLNQVNDQGKNEIQKLTTNLNEQASDNQKFLQSKIDNQTTQFHAQYSKQALENEKNKNQLENQYKLERIQTNRRQQGEVAKLTQAHDQFLQQKVSQFRQGLKEQEEFFQKRYATNQEANTKDAKNLEARYNAVVGQMKTEMAQELNKTKQRQDDSFYQFTELRPSWKKTETGIEVSVEIPEYSKQDLSLTTNNKEVILSFNRRFTDSNKSQEGTLNKVNKVESFTSRILTDVILDPKSVKANFENGVMTYQIKKA
jgi:HSP20 family molecular chaperone IbpA